MSCIVFDRINKSFRDKTVLKDITFQVDDGEIFGLLGPSGAGKTTILNTLTGRLVADSGNATLWGRSCDKLDAATLHRIGTVLDQDGLYDRLTCYDNLLLYARLYGIHRSAILPVLDTVQLRDAARKPVSQLSKGMKQRLVLARAILHKPDLLFLDEPTSGLDPATMQQIHELLRTLRQQGTTIMLTTHNMEEASTMCDRVALLCGGQIVEEGTPRDICLRYDTLHCFRILLENGQELSIPKTDTATLERLIREGQIRSIHSTEPTLETVFITKTGRRLV